MPLNGDKQTGRRRHLAERGIVTFGDAEPETR